MVEGFGGGHCYGTVMRRNIADMGELSGREGWKEERKKERDAYEGDLASLCILLVDSADRALV